MALTFLTPQRIVFGSGEIDNLGREVTSLGRRALVVSGASSMRRTGILDRARRALERAGVAVQCFDRVEHDPSLETVDAALDEARKAQADVVISLGGGSALDVAKSAAALADKPGGVADYFAGRRAIEAPGLPFVGVPTTSGTGAEITHARLAAAR